MNRENESKKIIPFCVLFALMERLLLFFPSWKRNASFYIKICFTTVQLQGEVKIIRWGKFWDLLLDFVKYRMTYTCFRHCCSLGISFSSDKNVLITANEYKYLDWTYFAFDSPSPNQLLHHSSHIIRLIPAEIYVHEISKPHHLSLPFPFTVWKF